MPVALILFYAPYFGLPYLIGFTGLMLAMSVALSIDINPKYRFEDIDVLDLRVCYNGEWFTHRQISQDTLSKLLNNEYVSADIKTGIKKSSLRRVMWVFTMFFLWLILENPRFDCPHMGPVVILIVLV